MAGTFFSVITTLEISYSLEYVIIPPPPPLRRNGMGACFFCVPESELLVTTWFRVYCNLHAVFFDLRLQVFAFTWVSF